MIFFSRIKKNLGNLYFLIPLAAIINFLLCLFWSNQYSVNAALQNDANSYYNGAVSCFENHQYLNAVIANREAGYPVGLCLFFYITGPSVFTAQLFNAIFSFFILVLGVFLLGQGNLRARQIACAIFSLSPMLTSFSGMIYSEIFSIFWILLTLNSIMRLRQGWKFSFLTGLGCFGVLNTKLSFLPLIAVISLYSLIKKEHRLAVPLIVALFLNYPEHARVQQGQRGLMQVAAQTAKVELWSQTDIVKCSIYNLSNALGSYFFADRKKVCALNLGTNTGDDSSFKNYEALTSDWIASGFDYFDGLKKIAIQPFKYFEVCLSTLPSGFWIDGFYSVSTRRLAGFTRFGLWLFKVLFSSCLWWSAIAMGLQLWRAQLRNDEYRVTLLLFVPMIYLVLFNMNMPAEQRHFMPLLPMLYILFSMKLSQVIEFKNKFQILELLRS